MDVLSILLISVGLAMDSFTVSICGGMTMTPVRFSQALRMAVFFGFFQALMPVLGWAGAAAFADLIQAYDHWIAFGLLGIIGSKMIWEALKEEACDPRLSGATLGVLLALSVATSIDALAVGVSFAFLGVSISRPVIAIGTITGAMSLIGVYLGRRFGDLFQGKVQILGGLILIGIGAKILVEHTGERLIALLS